MLSGDLRIRRFTPMAEQAFNLIASDVGRPFSDIQTHIGVPDLMSLISQVIDTLIPVEQDVQNRRGHWDILRIRPYRTTDNVIDGVVISLFDIDILKNSAIELTFSRNYANAIIETLRQPLLVLNADLQVVTANHAFYAVFQMSVDLTEHQSLFDLGEGEWNIPKLRSLLNEILTLNISVQDYEITQNFAQIGTRTMLLNACPIEQANQGKMILIAIEDITVRKLQKQQLIAQNQALSEAIAASDAANIAKSKFLGNVSHELRTPLNSIMGFSQLLQDSPSLDEEAKEFISIVYESGEHLFALIKDLLDISRIEADRMELEPKLIDLANFLKTTVDIVWLKAIQKNLALTQDFAPDLPETIFADDKRLKQVLLNLLSNAIKFTSVGAITFTVRKIATNNPNRNLIQFAIADSGAGIAASELTKIFLPFEQVGEVAVKTEGTGLGLAISQDIINRMGGEITVVSQIGVGSTFSFELDLSAPETPTSETRGLSPLPVPANPQHLISGAIASSTPPQTTNLLEAEDSLTHFDKLSASPSPSPAGEGDKRVLSILVAEDVTYNQKLIKIFLQKLGYQPDIANNGIEVLAKLCEKRYDVILMDIQMPQMGGMEATRRIVAEYAGDRPYIIAVSANSSEEEKAQYLELGMNAAIGKPYVLAELEQALSQVDP
jgi:two-component system CheB/CheR fusion protein